MKKTKTKCYLYTRVSTSMQVDGYSLDAQRDKLRKYAEYEDMVVAGEYSDEGFSGKNIQGRHEFQRMLQDIQDCKDGVEYVLVFKLSRFGRNAADVLNSLQLMQDFGVNLICVEDGIDSSKDSGKLMISVLSAVAEIERENIRTQTMAGREQKAREGKWNGGFAPYGYRLEKGELLIAEDEVDVIRTIFDRYIHTNDGVSGVAKYLNRQGFVKKLRQNGTIPGFSASFVKSIIDNPVYMGKIAYGRRRTEKKIGTRNEMHVVEQSEFPVYEGKHEAIISEEDWNLAQEKRKINAYRREKVNDPTHAHILSGILKCPCCGKSLYGNIAKAHSKDKKTRYYYYCKNTVTPTGHECTFRLNIEQTEMNRMVASIISAMVSDPRFANAIKAKIGSAVDTNDLEKQLEALQAQLRQTLGTKARLERQMDGLDVNDPYYDRKISDLQRRYDEQYGRIDEIEVQIDDVQSQIRNIRQEKISGDNIYRLLLAFDQVYEAASEVERKEFMRAFIERIELFPEKQLDGNWIRKIIFNFPVPVNGTEVKELPLENETMVDTRRVFAYLRSRGIDAEIINHCIKHGQLYEDAAHHNCVFVGYKHDKPTYGALRGTLSDTTFAGEVPGSDKRFSFAVPLCAGGKTLCVFESAIDALSYLTLLKLRGQDWRAANTLSLSGVYQPRKDGSIRFPAALEQYLKDNPGVARIVLCLDNDGPGRAASAAIQKRLSEYEVIDNPPRRGKDYNDQLQMVKGISGRVRTRGGEAR